jgi:hypothetical protein
MIAFIIPLKPKRNSRNWILDGNYLKRTLRSILNQTVGGYHIFVIIHDMPGDIIANSKIDYITFPYEYCEFEKIADRQEQMQRNSYLSQLDVEYLFDQGRKQMYGAQLAKQNGFDYIMCVDADDLVSKNLVNYINLNRNNNKIGWYVDKGYYFIAEKNVYLRQPYAMNMMNGSAYIIHRSFIPEVDPLVLMVNANNFFSNHPYLKTRIKEYFGEELQPLPFYAIIYVVTNLNWNATVEKLKGKKLYNILKYWARRVVFKKHIIKNFYLGD